MKKSAADQATVFCRMVRARSHEHDQVVALAAPRGLVGTLLSTIRQELDSMVRVIFLLTLDAAERERLVKLAVSGKRWTVPNRSGKLVPVTDADMVRLANNLEGWTASVYRFGCAFIHLSDYHDYGARDPLEALSDAERTDLLKHLRNYHGGPPSDHPKLADIVPLLPRVFAKVHDNLECYVKDLENRVTKRRGSLA